MKKTRNLPVTFLLVFVIGIMIPYFKVNASNTTSIMGQSQLTQEQLINYFRSKNSEKSNEYIKNFVSIVWQEASIEGIRADVVFIQMMEETNFLKFTGDVHEVQNNFGGIGATGGGACGIYFNDIRTGIRAVVQHLKAYCSTEELKNPCVDPRFTYVKRGITPYVEWLGIGQNPNYPDRGWAADSQYGTKIHNMITEAKKLSNINRSNKLNDNIDKNYNYEHKYKAKIQTYDIMLGEEYITSNRLLSGKTYTIKGYASSSNEVMYEFWVKEINSGSWTKIRDYERNRYANWAPEKSGQYIIAVNVKDEYSSANIDGRIEKSFTVQNSGAVSVNSTNCKSIVIDPGHGAYDSGAVGATGIMEKDVVLKISLKLGRILQNKGMEVTYTRTSDSVSWPSNVSQDLQARAAIANRVNPNLYISVHANSCDHPSVNGTETYYYGGGSNKSKQLAQNVQKELLKSVGLYNRGVKTAGFYVLKNTISPSILVELGFISNKDEEVLLNSDWFQEKCAEAIAKGILETNL